MNLNELVRELQQYLDILNVKQMNELDGDALSRLAVKLASYNATLGTFVADAERESGIADTAYEMAQIRAYKKLKDEGKSDTAANALRKDLCQEEARNATEMKHNHRVLQLLRSDTSNLIDTLRSRLSYLKFRDDL